MNIQYFLDQNTYGASMSRGIRLYNSKRIKSFAKDSVNNIIKVKVQGTRLYTVKIKHDLTDITYTECSCPYNYGGICKHTVAALLYTKEYLNKNPKALTLTRNKATEKLKKHNTGNWFNFHKIDNITEAAIRKTVNNNVLSTLYNRYTYGTKIIKGTFKNNELILKVNAAWEQEIINFKEDNKYLSTKCSCEKSIDGLCIHQATAIKILVEDRPDFFYCLTPDFKETHKKEAFKEYGLDQDDDFDDYFEFIYSDGNILLGKKSKGKGLLALDEIKGKNVENPISYLQKKHYSLKTYVPEDTDSKFELGYAFYFNEKKYGQFDAIELIPIYGKTDKSETKLSTLIRQLENREHDHNVYIPEEDEKICRLCKNTGKDAAKNYLERNNVHEIGEDNEYFIENLKYYISIFDDLLPLINKKRFLYVTSSYNISRNTILPIRISNITPEVSYKLTSDQKFIKLTASLKIGEEEFAFSSRKIKFHSFIFIEYNNKLCYINNVKTALLIYNSKISPVFKTTKNEAFNFFDNYVKPISEHYPVEIKTSIFKKEEMELEVQSKQLYISELGNFIMFTPIVKYTDGTLANILKKNNSYRREGKKITEIKRNSDFEDDFNNLIKSLHEKFKNQFPDEFYYLPVEDMVLKYWFFDAFEILKNEGVEIFGMEKLKKFKYSPHRANVSVSISSGQDWFDVEMTVKFGDYQVSLNEIKKAVLRQDRFIKLGDGSTGILPEEWVEKFEKYLRHGQVKKDGVKISKLKFSLIDELFDEQDYSEILEEIETKKRKLKNFEEIKKVKVPKEITGKLRDYQLSGYNWLNFLDEFSWGGILADDMGLGKTFQILAFLQLQVKKSKKPNLIILPTTLLFNWENEIKKFAPELTAYFHYGTSRETDPKKLKGYNLIISTYGLLINDIEFIRKISFNYAILDESQAIKNPASKRFKAASLLKAQNRLAMTGTPIENNTFDLYAQMEFVNPGFLGNQNQFKTNYSTPIDKDGDAERSAELQKIISPFVLRRTKEQVATELPEKTEDFIYCTMESEQRKVYDAFRNKYRNFLMDKIETDGLGKSKLYVLQGLTKLRQICDSPELLSDEEDFGTNSIKIKEIIRHIKEKTANHKILVFSQFVTMLKIIEREIKKENIEYEYLDGQSSKKARQLSVDNFQNNADIRVFLISLKAGGTGINLTEADYVYIVDPWWNPAVENQAIDRCHRIGQSKKVIAYRMICKDTIEEKIMSHQAKKRKIASDIISADESFVKKLTAKDINSLFE